MTPMITLHHFVHPQWFEDLGAFTNMDNVKHFVSFCQVAFRWAGQLGMPVAQVLLQSKAATCCQRSLTACCSVMLRLVTAVVMFCSHGGIVCWQPLLLLFCAAC